MTLISIKSTPVLSASGDNFREENAKKNWSERFLLKVYIVVCCFSLIIFSTVELTSFATRFARRELCSLLIVSLNSCRNGWQNNKRRAETSLWIVCATILKFKGLAAISLEVYLSKRYVVCLFSLF